MSLARLCGVVLLGMWLWSGLALAQPAPPEKLTWRDLVNHPERWPAECKLGRDIRFNSGESVKAGATLTVVAVEAQDASVRAGKILFGVQPKDCDLLDAANAAWAKLTPEQRAFTPAVLLKDRTLWPGKIKAVSEMDYGQFKIPAGAALTLLDVGANNEIAMYYKGNPAPLRTPLTDTDLMTRGRELAGLSSDKRPARVPLMLEGLVLDLENKPATLEPAAEYYVNYWTGSACPRCEIFTPKFVAYYNKSLAGRKDVQVVGTGVYPDDAGSLEYAKKNNITWPQLGRDGQALANILLYKGGNSTIQLPAFFVFDKSGKLVLTTHNMRGNPMQNAETAMAQLEKLINEKKAN